MRDGDTEGIQSEEDEGALIGGCHSISNEDATDCLHNPVVPRRVSDLPFIVFLLQLLCRRGINRE